MSSKIDVSLDELVKKNRSFRRGRGRRGGTRGFGGRGGGRGQATGLSLSTRGNRGGRGNAGRGRGMSISTRGGLKTAANVTLTPGADLRDKLKKTMPDLRSAIKARNIRENKAQEGIKTGFRASSSSVSSRETSSRTRTLSNQTSSSRSTKRSLPSSSRPTRSAGNTPDPKKIRITVPGLSHPRSEVRWHEIPAPSAVDDGLSLFAAFLYWHAMCCLYILSFYSVPYCTHIVVSIVCSTCCFQPTWLISACLCPVVGVVRT